MPWLYLLAMLIVVCLLVLVVVVNHVVQVRQRNVKDLFAVTVNRDHLHAFPILFPEIAGVVEQVLCVRNGTNCGGAVLLNVHSTMRRYSKGYFVLRKLDFHLCYLLKTSTESFLKTSTES